MAKIKNDTAALVFRWGYFGKYRGYFGKEKSQIGSHSEAYQPQKVLILEAISAPEIEGHFSSSVATFRH